MTGPVILLVVNELLANDYPWARVKGPCPVPSKPSLLTVCRRVLLRLQCCLHLLVSVSNDYGYIHPVFRVLCLI